MAHPDNPEAGRAPATVADAAADFENYLFPDEDEQGDDTAPEGDGDEADEAEDLELDDEEQDDEDSGPEPATAPPVSLTAEEKKVFAQLPPEAQQAWAASENRRNSQVQEATTKASTAQRDAEARAAAADAEAKSLYSQQLDQFVKAFEPQAPDPQLAYHDPARYIAEKAHFDALKAQHDTLVQQVRGISQEADVQAQQAFIAQRDRELLAIPEVANPETRAEYLTRAMGVAADLGFDQAELSQNASASDIKALAKVADWKAKAERYEKAMSRQMQKVRSGKSKTLRPNAAPHASARAARGEQDWNRVKTARSKNEQAEAMADFLGL